MARALGFSRGVASSSPIIGILTVNFSAGTRSSCVQWSHCTSRMSSQPQLRYEKHIMIQFKELLSSSIGWGDGLQACRLVQGKVLNLLRVLRKEK